MWVIPLGCGVAYVIPDVIYVVGVILKEIDVFA